MSNYIFLKNSDIVRHNVGHVNGNPVTKVEWIRHTLGVNYRGEVDDRGHYLHKKCAFESTFAGKTVCWKKKYAAFNYAAVGNPDDNSWRGYWDEDTGEFFVNPNYNIVMI